MLLGPLLNGFASGSISLVMLSSSLNNSSATELVGDESEEEEAEDDEDPKAVKTVLVDGAGATVVVTSLTSSSTSSSSVATSSFSFFPPRSFLFASSAFVKEIGGRGNPSPELKGYTSSQASKLRKFETTTQRVTESLGKSAELLV